MAASLTVAKPWKDTRVQQQTDGRNGVLQPHGGGSLGKEKEGSLTQATAWAGLQTNSVLSGRRRRERPHAMITCDAMSSAGRLRVRETNQGLLGPGTWGAA